ncbi:MAG TPA: matrixin family metalloprotease [Gemmataceae bacterium]|jgi:predicted Zn-dependent protease|nr:matrixin family metalloprotease [Gemmataceae bacterium]
MRLKRRRLLLELLEDRLTPATTGVPWPDPGNLTLSFVPDGTNIGGQPSQLFSTLNAQAPTAAWETAILQAMETWESYANINVGVVADDGLPAGTAGALQGDSRFGDIRVSAVPLANTAVSTAAFFSYAGSTWSGDVQLNSNESFGINGNGNIDLYTIALHELGHSLGLLDTYTDTSSVMYGYYMGPRTGLDSQDIADIQSLYGPRQPNGANTGFSTATPVGNLSSQLAFNGTLNSPSDADYYKITTPLALGLTSINVQIQTQGYSLLTPTVSIYNASHQLLATQSSSSPLNGNVQVTIKGALPLATYYIEVSHATSAFAVGSYKADVIYKGALLSLGGIVSTLDYVVDLANNTLKSATVLAPLFTTQTDQRFDSVYRADLSYSTEANYYKIQAPATLTANEGWTMHALVWAADSNMLHPIIHVFDSAGNPLPIQVLDNTNGEYTIQGTGYVPKSVYYVEVQAWTPSGANSIGDYVLAVKFDVSTPVAYSMMAAATLTAASASSNAVLTMNQNQLYQFSLAADTLQTSEDASVTMSVYDSQGNLVLSLTAVAGRPPVTQLLYLTTGSYTIDYTAQSLSGGPMPDVDFWFQGSDFSEPSGPYYVSPGGTAPTTGPSGPGNGNTYTSSSPTTGTAQPYYY